MKAILIVAWLTMTVEAKTLSLPVGVDLFDVKVALEAEGFNVHVYGINGAGFVDMSDDESRDPSEIIEGQVAATLAKENAKDVADSELAALKAKLRAKTATQDDKDRLLEILLEGK